MVAASVDQLVAAWRIQRQQATVERRDERRCPSAVVPVEAIVVPLRIVEIGKELDDDRIGARIGGKAQTIVPHPVPMRLAVDAIQVEGELLPDEGQQSFRDHDCSHPRRYHPGLYLLLARHPAAFVHIHAGEHQAADDEKEDDGQDA